MKMKVCLEAKVRCATDKAQANLAVRDRNWAALDGSTSSKRMSPQQQQASQDTMSAQYKRSDLTRNAGVAGSDVVVHRFADPARHGDEHQAGVKAGATSCIFGRPLIVSSLFTDLVSIHVHAAAHPSICCVRTIVSFSSHLPEPYATR